MILSINVYSDNNSDDDFYTADEFKKNSRIYQEHRGKNDPYRKVDQPEEGKNPYQTENSDENIGKFSFETMEYIYGGAGYSSKYIIFEGFEFFFTTKNLKIIAAFNLFLWKKDKKDEDVYTKEDFSKYGYFLDLSAAFFPIVRETHRHGFYLSGGYYRDNFLAERGYLFNEAGLISEFLFEEISTIYVKIGAIKFYGGGTIFSFAFGRDFLF